MLDLRGEQISRLKQADLDVLVLGGGINGAGVIRDLALRGSLRAGLVEQNHFASGTSGKNSQLIHGGLRYLKYFQIPLVREALRERATLLKIAPQFVKPLPFLLPMYGAKSRLVYGTGLWLYDLLAGSSGMKRHRIVSAKGVAELEPSLTREGLTAAAIFYDAAVLSARFTVENVLDAIARGAIAANYVRADNWERTAGGQWGVSCTDTLSGERFTIGARKLVSARGAWSSGDDLRLVRGSHIILPRLNASDNAIAHFESDGRIVFLIPWGTCAQLTLVGTTDEDHREGPDSVHISERETAYLMSVVRKLYPSSSEGLSPIATFSSLRPLVRDSGASATSTSRGHKIWNAEDGVLHIAGGKYTTYRAMSEEASDLVCREITPDLAAVHRSATTAFPQIDRAIGEQMEQHLSDYLYVSTYLGYERRWDVASLRPLAANLGALRGWTESRIDAEINSIVDSSQPGSAAHQTTAERRA